MQPVERYALIFKTFTMDPFVQRRLAKVAASAPSADIYVIVDETRGSVGPIDFPRVIRCREDDLIKLGFAGISQGSLFWYNADYLLYYFQYLQPSYDIIVMVEYDAVPNTNLDIVVQKCRDQKLDFIGQPIEKPVDTYWWTASLLRYYRRAQVRPYLICAAVFSAQAVRHLAECRLRHGQDYDRSDATQWPIGEAFVGTELASAGFRVRDLSSFGRLTRYDWWPPVHEFELPDCTDQVFVHPVLNGRRYVSSIFKSGFVSGLIVVCRNAVPALARLLWRRASWSGG